MVFFRSSELSPTDRAVLEAGAGGSTVAKISHVGTFSSSGLLGHLHAVRPAGVINDSSA